MLNRKSVDYYAEHLVKVNETSKVILSDDIYNHHGVLVAKKNVEMNQRTAAIIAKHKLIKPIEASVRIENSFCKQLTLETVINRLNRGSLQEIVECSGLFDGYVSPYSILGDYDLVDQKLTVMSHRLPDILDRTLLSSVFSYGLSGELGLSEERMESVFLSTMMADLGLLHLPSDLVLKKGQFSPHELRMMQGHVAIAKHFSDLVPNIPKAVGKIILEHHERSDGFGYPFGKPESKISIEGQILAMSDTVSALYRKFVMNGQCSWNAVSAILQVPNSAHSETVRNAMLRFLKKVNVPINNKYCAEQFGPLIESLKSKYHRLNQWFYVISQILDLHKKELGESDSFRPYTLMKELNKTIVTSGLLSEVQLDWLECLVLPPSDSDKIDIEEFELKIGEVEYQCLFVMKKMYIERQEFSRRFHSDELAKHYYAELVGILNGADVQEQIPI